MQSRPANGWCRSLLEFMRSQQLSSYNKPRVLTMPAAAAECRNLQTVSVTAANVRSVNVMYCTALTTLALRCPALEVLVAAGCTALTSFKEQVSFPRLQRLNLSCVWSSQNPGVGGSQRPCGVYVAVRRGVLTSGWL